MTRQDGHTTRRWYWTHQVNVIGLVHSTLLATVIGVSPVPAAIFFFGG